MYFRQRRETLNFRILPNGKHFVQYFALDEQPRRKTDLTTVWGELVCSHRLARSWWKFRYSAGYVNFPAPGGAVSRSEVVVYEAN